MQAKHPNSPKLHPRGLAKVYATYQKHPNCMIWKSPSTALNSYPPLMSPQELLVLELLVVALKLSSLYVYGLIFLQGLYANGFVLGIFLFCCNMTLLSSIA